MFVRLANYFSRIHLDLISNFLVHQTDETTYFRNELNLKISDSPQKAKIPDFDLEHLSTKFSLFDSFTMLSFSRIVFKCVHAVCQSIVCILHFLSYHLFSRETNFLKKISSLIKLKDKKPQKQRHKRRNKKR